MRKFLVLLVLWLGWNGVAAGVGLPTSEVAIVGAFAKGPVDLALEVNESEFAALFGSPNPGNFQAEAQVRQFFRNGGNRVQVVRLDPTMAIGPALVGSLDPPNLKGLGALLPRSEIGLLLCPELSDLNEEDRLSALAAIEILGEERPLFTILDPPSSVDSVAEMNVWRQNGLPTDLQQTACYFPKLVVDPASWSGGSSATRVTMGASGTVAAVIQRSDSSRGVWKAPAGSEASFIAEGLSLNASDSEIDALASNGVNGLREIPGFGQVIWGSRTLSTSVEERYVSVSRTQRWITRSLQRALSDAALETNDGALRADLESRAEDFLDDLFRQGAFAGTTASGSYFAKCDADTTSAGDVQNHRANLLIGCAYLRESEFILATIPFQTLDLTREFPETPLLVSEPVDGFLHATYPSTPGFTHTLQLSQRLIPGGWVNGNLFEGDGSWRHFKISTADQSLFFRVRTERGP